MRFTAEHAECAEQIGKDNHLCALGVHCGEGAGTEPESERVRFTAEFAENAESEDGRTLSAISAFHLPRTQVPGSAVRGLEERQA